MEPELRGTLSAYAKWAGISLNAAIQRNRRGQIVFCEKYPHLVDFVRSNAAARTVGRPKKANVTRKYRVVWWMTAEEYADMARRHRNWQKKS